MSTLLRSIVLSSLYVLGCDSSVSSDGSGGGGEGGQGGGAPSTCEAPPSPEAFEIGTGEACFERLEVGQVVPLVQGPQGGFHVWVAMSCTGCSAEMHLRYGALDPATGEHFENTYPSEGLFELSGDVSSRQRAMLTAVMPGVPWDPENFPPLEKGAPVRLYVEHLEDGMVVERSEVDVVLGDTVSWDPCAENPESEFCGFG